MANAAATWSIAGATIVVLVSGAAVGGQDSETGLGKGMDRLVQMAENLLDSTMQRLSFCPLGIETAHATKAEAGGVGSITLMVRLGGSANELALDDLIFVDEAGNVLGVLEVEVLRDEDGSITDHNTMDRGDLALIQISIGHLAEPWQAGGTHQFTCFTSEHSGVTYQAEVPAPLDAVSRLEIRRTG